jgi:hypothetical protein
MQNTHEARPVCKSSIIRVLGKSDLRSGLQFNGRLRPGRSNREDWSELGGRDEVEEAMANQCANNC